METCICVVTANIRDSIITYVILGGSIGVTNANLVNCMYYCNEN